MVFARVSIRNTVKWRESVNKGGAFYDLLIDCLQHKPFIAKLHTYGFDTKSLNLIYDYLSNRTQRVKLGRAYSSWRQMLYGFPQ